jgi:hypothetical protein
MNTAKNNPIAQWNHRLPALACAVLVTGLVLSGIAQLAEPDLNRVQIEVSVEQSKTALASI